jgi:uncharacterized tellurite resistance protein B-like protein
MPSSIRYWAFRFLLGIVILVVAGTGQPARLLTAALGHGEYVVVDVLFGFCGFFLSFFAVTPLARMLGEDARLRRDWGAQAHDSFVRSTTPRQVFLLLLAVAEADGRARPDERELVRRFLLQRFVDPVSAKDLASWEAEGLRTKDLAGLARRVARGMDAGERATLFSWACLVAFVDDHFDAAEHEALQAVAQGLGLSPTHARVLFHFAREAYFQRRAGQPHQQPRFRSQRPRPEPEPQPRPQQQRQQQQQQRQRWQYEPPPRRTPPATPRESALATLGLSADASPDAIRKRHRELVRRFHPDAQPNLGPVAQQEATERFRAIQHAYEVLLP